MLCLNSESVWVCRLYYNYISYLYFTIIQIHNTLIMHKEASGLFICCLLAVHNIRQLKTGIRVTVLLLPVSSYKATETIQNPYVNLSKKKKKAVENIQRGHTHAEKSRVYSVKLKRYNKMKLAEKPWFSVDNMFWSECAMWAKKRRQASTVFTLRVSRHQLYSTIV